MLAKTGKHELGYQKIIEAYQIFIETNDRLYQAISLVSMASYFQHKGNFNRSIELASQAIEIGEEIGILSKLITWTRDLSKLYVSNGQMVLAYEMLEKHGQLKDSLNAQNNSKAIAEMEARFQTEKKQLEIEKLHTKGKIQDLALEHEHNQRIWVTVGLVLSILLIVLVGFALIQKRRDNQLISA